MKKTFSSVNYIDFEFILDDATGAAVSEFEFQETVFNSSGSDWASYNVQLGFGTGAGFTPSTAGDGLDFDAPDYNSLFSFGPFSSVTIGEDSLTAFGGSFLDGTSASVVFPIDVPDGIGVFTVRQMVSTSAPVPEPSTWALAVLGLVGLGVVARRRKRSA